MIDDGPLRVLAIVVAVGCGAAGGVFFAFSVFVMPALGRLPAARGMAAMQAVNVAAITPLFMALLFGTGLGAVVLAVAAGLRWDEGGAAPVLLASVVYVAGVLVSTIAYHVPRNDALAAADAEVAPSAGIWATYLRDWTRWNHLRAAAGIAAAAILTAALAG